MPALRPVPAPTGGEVATMNDLRRRVDELTRERDQLLIVVDLLQELSARTARLTGLTFIDESDASPIAASIGPVKAMLAEARAYLNTDDEPPVRPAPR